LNNSCLNLWIICSIITYYMIVTLIDGLLRFFRRYWLRTSILILVSWKVIMQICQFSYVCYTLDFTWYYQDTHTKMWITYVL
jgi:hypothetical protein